MKRVVITGMGAITPIGNSIHDFWSSVKQGKSGANLISRFDTTHFKTKFACEVKNFNPLDYLDKKESRKMDLFCQYGIASTEEAIKDAGINFDTINKDKVGVIWSSGIGGFVTFQEEVLAYAQSKVPKFNPFFITKMISDIVPGYISIKFGLRGINFGTVSACASSTNAIVDAFNYLRLGKANIIIAGGSEAPVIDAGIGGFNAMKALSENNEEYSKASRPFDKTRDGFVLGEGSGTLILEELEQAKSRGARIYAEIIGGGLAADAYHITATHPEGIGAYLAMKDALEDAHISPSEVDYINCHATSTPLGDPSELAAIDRLFNGQKLHISATKSMTGHLLGAAGAVEAIIAIKSIDENIIPPTINTNDLSEFNLAPGIEIVTGKHKSTNVDVAMSNTFGFGGHNAIALFRRYKE
ncbi:beta-ketoacyl-ACP synthase II [Sporocytophaga myxococcoides]|uniref:beta-ketoacyl-ACP synthase II n=1 Tax=Sporocytophaga myxococcoides TaxID=153721 RepID=UPI000402A717|nr:beta-ketoacyl-ACP synthase II [Sporocytophaga myxococcoides]